jgi:hypothetical protein
VKVHLLQQLLLQQHLLQQLLLQEHLLQQLLLQELLIQELLLQELLIQELLLQDLLLINQVLQAPPLCQGAISFHQELLHQMDKDLGQLTKEQEPGDTSTVGMLQMVKKVVLTVDLL